MWDRQYFSSLAIFAAAVVATFSGIMSLLLWLGWLGLVGLLTVVGGWLAWFYWGPRPDLKPKGSDDEFNEPENE